MPFKKLGLSDKLVQSVEAAGYTMPTDIQSQAIPIVLQGKDIIGCAQTGTGKTAAFVLPVLQRLFIDNDNAAPVAHAHDKKAPKYNRIVRALVLTPTRELALQVEESVQEYGKFTGVKPLAVYGGVGLEPQIRALKQGVDFVVATPGRLLDLIERRCIDLSKIEVLVLDEADRMLDMGFIHDVRKVISMIPKERQTLLFSATISNDIKKLADGVQNNPVVVQVGERHNPAESVTQYIYDAPREKKLDMVL
ncbi:MAG TPA: DEAD/DEAH box helicase, partial [Candidatus Kapabacteria bacterium]|nr:DEAD/DEAH box helicase [Candidatus Kapabacteria bacterium]